MRHRTFARSTALLCILLTLALVGATYAKAGLLPFNTGWEYAHFTTFRPANAATCDVNPPRFSWPYVPHVLTERKDVKQQDFAFQLSSTGGFMSPDTGKDGAGLAAILGFNLLNESPIRSEVDQEYAITLTFQDGRLRYYIDRKKIHDVTDPDPCPAAASVCGPGPLSAGGTTSSSQNW